MSELTFKSTGSPILFLPTEAKSPDEWLFHQKPLKDCDNTELKRCIEELVILIRGRDMV